MGILVQYNQMKKLQLLLSLGLMFLIACQPSTNPKITPTTPSTPTASESRTPSASLAPSITSTPQPRQQLADYGPELEDFPTGYNPLTGLPVQDPSMLNLPAVLVSISNMPVTARPQAGLSLD